jgi:hypothetical protein
MMIFLCIYCFFYALNAMTEFIFWFKNLFICFLKSRESMRLSNVSTSRNSKIERIYLIIISNTNISMMMNLKKNWLFMIVDESYKYRLNVMLKLQNWWF